MADDGVYDYAIEDILFVYWAGGGGGVGEVEAVGAHIASFVTHDIKVKIGNNFTCVSSKFE